MSQSPVRLGLTIPPDVAGFGQGRLHEVHVACVGRAIGLEASVVVLDDFVVFGVDRDDSSCALEGTRL